MKLLYLFLLLFLCHSSNVLSQLINNNNAIIWRGFEHNWTYNHRINRIGNYVQFDNAKPKSIHWSASGFGADSTRFTSHYSFVQSPSTYFQEGVVNIKLNGREKELITKEVQVSIPATSDMSNCENFTTLLNGFDIQAVGRADKIQLLRISIEDASYAPAVNELHFTVHIALVANCQSLECSRFVQRTNYDVNIFFLVVSGNDDNFSAQRHTLTDAYPWTKKLEMEHSLERHTITGRRGGEYKNATLGIKSLSLALNEAHWTIAYHSNVTPLIYNASSGEMDYNAEMFFKEWVVQMKVWSAFRKHSRYSSKRKGWCIQDMGIVLLQFKDATISHHKHSGSLFWKGKNAPPTNDDAKFVKELEFPVPAQSKN